MSAKPEPEYDLLVLGAGSGGLAAAKRAASHGARVAIVEQGRVGGTCVIRGCIPKKLMFYAAHLGELRALSEGYGWAQAPAEFSWERLVAMRDGVVGRLEKNHEGHLKRAGVELIRGRARFAGPRSVEVEGRRLGARYFLIATGSSPVMPKIAGCEHAQTSDEFFTLKQRPFSAVLVGGGYIAAEFAGILQRLGCQTTLVVRSKLLREFDEEVAAHLADALRRQGVALHMPARVDRVERTPTGFHLHGLKEGAPLELSAEACLLYAVGRKPNTQEMGLEEAGVALGEKGEVVVDDDHQSARPHVFAVGDVTDRANLTPVAIAAGRVVADRLFGGGKARLSYEMVPTAVFSQPPIGAVGLTEARARERFGDEVEAYKTRFAPLLYSGVPEEKKQQTFMKLVVHSSTGRVLGCHMIGDDAPEIIQALAVALAAGVTKAQFDATMALHPTSAEEFVLMG